MVEPIKPRITKGEARYSFFALEKGRCRDCISSHFDELTKSRDSQMGRCDRIFGVIDRIAFCDEYQLRPAKI